MNIKIFVLAILLVCQATATHLYRPTLSLWARCIVRPTVCPEDYSSTCGLFSNGTQKTLNNTRLPCLDPTVTACKSSRCWSLIMSSISNQTIIYLYTKIHLSICMSVTCHSIIHSYSNPTFTFIGIITLEVTILTKG
jgi:hypothetical protein